MTSLGVYSVGASTPVGIDAAQTALIMRAGKAAPRASPFRDRHGNAFGSIRSRRLDDALFGRDRLVALAKPALEEALENIPASMRRDISDDRPVVLLVALAEPLEGEAPTFGADVLGDIAKTAHLRLDPRSEAIRIGHAGFGAVLARAATLATDVPVIVGAVDSYHDPVRLLALDEGYRILGEHADNGFTPSEGASFACVMATGRRKMIEAPLSIVRFVACGEEKIPYPPMAVTLTALTRDERLPRPVPWAVSDMNGELHREREWTYMRIRNEEVFHHLPEKTYLDNPVISIGELGAASGAVYLTYVTMGFSLGFAPGPSALLIASSEGRERAIVFVERASS